MDKNDQSNEVTLHVTKKTQTDLEDAIKNFPSDSFAILYSPNKCFLALFKNGQFYGENGAIDISNVFEARLFNKTAELRWLKDGDMGTALILSEDEQIKFDENVSSGKYQTIDQNYLVWGQSVGIFKNGWTEFGTARIESFYVPLPNIAAQEYAKFTAVEYLKAEEKNGNVFVMDERLTGIKAYRPKGETENGK